MKKLMAALTLLTCVVAFASTSFASWDTCKVKRIGSIGNSTTSLKVGNCGISGNNDKWLAIVNQVDRQMAVVLTARSLGASIKVDADFASATTNGSTLGAITTIYLEEN